MNITMETAGVASVGAQARWIGDDVGGNGSHVEGAWESGAAAGIAGFQLYGALSAYTETMTAAVRHAGTRIGSSGGKLSQCAHTVGADDASSSSDVDDACARISSINTEVVP